MVVAVAEGAIRLQAPKKMLILLLASGTDVREVYRCPPLHRCSGPSWTLPRKEEEPLEVLYAAADVGEMILRGLE